MIFSGSTRIYSLIIVVLNGIIVFGGINVVTKAGVVFAMVVFSTLFIYYYGLVAAPDTPAAYANPQVGLLVISKLK